MTVEEIKELVAIANESGVAELEVQRGENRVRIRRQSLPAPQEIVLTAPAQQQVVSAAPQIAAASAATHFAPTAPAKAAIEEPPKLIKSPIVGTFYESPSPGAPPFVKVGDHVRPGQVLCIIESMKLMNEIEAEEEGVIAAKLVETGRPVEYGEALFALSGR
jgi:acetyl-CoA carboxylase biotin carboxyl carrier protein